MVFFLSTFFLLFHFLQFRWAALRSVCCYYSQWLCEYTNALLETIFNTACCLLIRERWCSALFTPPNGLYDSLIELNEAQLFHCHSAQTHSAHTYSCGKWIERIDKIIADMQTHCRRRVAHAVNFQSQFEIILHVVCGGDTLLLYTSPSTPIITLNFFFFC